MAGAEGPAYRGAALSALVIWRPSLGFQQTVQHIWVEFETLPGTPAMNVKACVITGARSRTSPRCRWPIPEGEEVDLRVGDGQRVADETPQVGKLRFCLDDS